MNREQLRVTPRGLERLKRLIGVIYRLVLVAMTRIADPLFGGAETFIRFAWYSLVLGTPRGDGGSAPSPLGVSLDGSPIPLGSTATHEPTEGSNPREGRWKSLEGVCVVLHPLGTNGEAGFPSRLVLKSFKLHPLS